MLTVKNEINKNKIKRDLYLSTFSFLNFISRDFTCNPNPLYPQQNVHKCWKCKNQIKCSSQLCTTEKKKLFLRLSQTTGVLFYERTRCASLYKNKVLFCNNQSYCMTFRFLKQTVQVNISTYQTVQEVILKNGCDR